MDRLEQDRQAQQARLLGRGLAFELVHPGLDLTRDLRLTRSPDTGRTDLATVSGTDNLAQALEVAFTTLRGSDVFDTAFGFAGLAALAAPTEPVLARQQLRVAVIGVLNRDPRIARILDVRLDDGRREAGEESDDARRLRTTRTLAVEVELETVTQERLVVSLGEVPDA